MQVKVLLNAEWTINCSFLIFRVNGAYVLDVVIVLLTLVDKAPFIEVVLPHSQIAG